jgi:hypothetical protein
MPARWLLVVSIAAMGLASNAASASPPRVRYDGNVVVRVDPANLAELDMILDIADDVWSERIGVGPLDVMLGPDGLAALDASGLGYRMLVEDVQVLVDGELDRLGARSPAAPPGMWFDDYREYEQVNSYLDWLAKIRPDLVTVFEIGQSIEGRTIHAVRISGPGEDKPAVLLNGCQHAREWITVMVTTCIADRLVAGYDVDATIQSLVDDLEFLIVPIVNPDGFEYTWEVERLWRKNRRDGHGVDLNRNWGVAWGGPGSSGDPEHGNYRGEAPFSEPETAALRDLVLANETIVSHIDIHSYGQLILHPWGFDHVTAPAADTFIMLGEMLREAILGEHGEGYASIQGAEFYPAAGVMPDWTYGDRGTYAFTIELRPDGEDEEFPHGFLLPPEEIIPTCEESLAAVIELASWSVDREPGEPGGDPWVPDTDTSTDTDDGSGTQTDGGDDGETGEGTSSGGSGSDEETAGTSDGPSDDDTGSAAGQEATATRACVCRSDRTGGEGILPLAVGLVACTQRRRRRD